jgi:hypothetical protein
LARLRSGSAIPWSSTGQDPTPTEVWSTRLPRGCGFPPDTCATRPARGPGRIMPLHRGRWRPPGRNPSPRNGRRDRWSCTRRTCGG